jgi:hypothetical protein
MKKFKIYFWISTIFIVLFEGVMPLLTYNTELAREGIRHLGYPVYFGTALVVFKVLGCVLLIIPKLPPRAKEWAYAGFTFDFVFACISHWVVDGMGLQTLFPLFILVILLISYVNYHRLLAAEKSPVNEIKTNRFQSPVSG